MLPNTAAEDETRCGAARPDTLLGWLRSDISADAVRPAPGRTLRPGDRSIQVHSCHGPARRSTCCAMCCSVCWPTAPPSTARHPGDVSRHRHLRPLITAGFGLAEAGDGHPAHRLRVRLADRAPTDQSAARGDRPAARPGRWSGQREQIPTLAEMGPVRSRFGFTDDDLDVIKRLGAQIRDPVGLRRRAPAALRTGAYVHSTWHFGLDQVLCRVAMSDDSEGWLRSTLPLDDVSSNQVELVGRFAEFVDRVQWTVDSLSGIIGWPTGWTCWATASTS